MLNFDFQLKNEIDEFKPDIEQQRTVATKHQLSTNRPGNSINQLVHFIMTQYSTRMQKGSSQDYRVRGLSMTVSTVSVHKVKIKQDKKFID